MSEPVIVATDGVPEYRNFIAGRWQTARSGATMASYNPATGEVIARVPRSTRDDMNEAIRAARQAFETSPWRDEPSRRARALLRMAQALEQNFSRLAELNTRENGKPLADSRQELSGSIDTLYYAAGLARNVMGRSRVNNRQSLSMVIREPLGVVGQIVPWNYPIILLFRELAPALAAGNAVVVKPASATSAITAEIFATFAHIEELPPGILSLVMGSGQEIGNALVESPDVDMIALTGSVETGKSVMRAASATLKKVHLELGGKSPNVLFADADLDRALPTILRSAFVNAGQFCMCGSRLVVEESIHADVVAWLKSAAEAIRVGNGLDPTTEMGPLISESQLATVLHYCDLGRRDAVLVTGGRRLTGPEHTAGNFVAPTIFDRVPIESPLAQEEIFGPVLAVQPFRSEEEAVRIANGTKFGLVAGLWTRDLDRALWMAKRLKAGTVWTNTYNRLFPELEFGGTGESGLGRTRGIDGLHEFTETKHINIEMASK